MSVSAPEQTAVAGVRLFTRAPITLGWLSRSVVPVTRALRDSGRALVHLRRGWLHGPHVDIVGRQLDPTGAVWRDVAAKLDAGPTDPATELTDEAYLAQARELGRLEAIEPPYLPMREHGATELLLGRHLASREPALDPLREVVLGVLARPLIDTIDGIVADPASAPLLLAEAFVALADTHTLGVDYGSFSFRSHAEAFLAWAGPTTQVRPTFARRLAGEEEMFRTVVSQRLSGQPSRNAAAWRTAFAYCAGTLDSAVAAGTLTVPMLDAIFDDVDTSHMGPPGAPDVVPTGPHPDSEFHATVAESGVVAQPSKWFAGYRLLVNLFYQQLPLLTVSPLQRYYTCHAVAETVDAVSGDSWRELLAGERARWAGTGVR